MSNNQLTPAPDLPILVHNLENLQAALLELAQAGKTVAFVPTMGALHSGHISLIEQGFELADAVVVSIFVNPRQFGAGEDFEQYPRNLEADLAVAQAAGVNIVYAPDVADMYPEGFVFSISVGEIGKILCGKSRVGHFDGVAIVVAKLLLRVMPHFAIFGLKDYQQFYIIQRLVADLDIPTEIVGAEIVRDADGLALSSRNRYLSADERKIAPILYQTIVQVAAEIPQIGADGAINKGISELTAQGFVVDYLEIFEERLLVAVKLGKTRLLDNVELVC
jgi:pantoate--beta-alanine ligase